MIPIIYKYPQINLLGHFIAHDLLSVIKYLNASIIGCPKYSPDALLDPISCCAGLTDTLIIISEAYSQLGKFEDALLSARLAVTTAHSRLELIQKVRNKFIYLFNY